MPPKTIFSKEQIIDAAFDIFKEEGIESITVRKLADRLNSSTAPIYTSFGNVEDIKKQLLDKALILLLEYTEKEYTKDIFLNIGMGLLEFAKEYKTVYRTLFMENTKYKHILKEFDEKNLLQMKKEKQLSIFEENDLVSMLHMMFVYTHGIAALLCAGMLEDESREYFKRVLLEMGDCVIGSFIYRRGLMEKFESEMRREC